MKKRLFLYILRFLLVIILCSFCYNLGLKNGLIKSTKLNDAINSNYVQNENVFVVIDYPLIEINFYPSIDNKWVIIDRVGITSEDSEYYIIQENSVLHWQTDKIRLITFQQGRGTTPNGVFYIYNNMKLIKEVPYLKIYIDSEELKNEFKQVTLREVEKLINQKLPPLI